MIMSQLKRILLLLSLVFGLRSYSQVDQGSVSPVISMDSLFRMKAKESIGKPFPTFNAVFSGYPLTKDSLKGKVVFMNFWFEACPPCIAELEALNKLYKKFAVNPDFEFISFTYESPEKIIQLKKKYHIPYKVASINSQECYRLNQNNGFPTSIILDRDGIIYELFTGGDTDKKVAETFISGTVYQCLERLLRK